MKASAPGKIILFGEHAVVYGRPALAAPVSQIRAEVEVTSSPRPGIWIDAPGIGLHAEFSTLPPDHPLAAAIRNVLRLVHEDSPSPLQISISSGIPVASGLGSGTAVSVALVRALSSALDRPLSDEEVSAQAFEIEKLHHGTPSGIDNTVVTHDKPVFFSRGQPIERLRVGREFSIVIGDTGISASTREAVGDVRKLYDADRQKWDRTFDDIGSIARKARAIIENGAWSSLGPLMDQNHALLQQLTVSSPELDRLIDAARRAGALGAKLSGGGRGGNMLALPREGEAQSISEALKSAGATRVFLCELKPSS